jgi:hypothetical protein
LSRPSSRARGISPALSEGRGVRELAVRLERAERAYAAMERAHRAAVRERDALLCERARKDAELVRLRAQVATFERENRRIFDQVVRVEQDNAHVASLLVASQRLASASSRRDVLAAITEIVVNLVGSEELAIFEVDPSGRELRFAASFGIERAALSPLRGDAGLVGAVVRSGERYVATTRRGLDFHGTLEERLTACIPLMADEKLVGVITVFRVLDQKGDLESVDHALFDLLTAEGGAALARARARA